MNKTCILIIVSLMLIFRPQHSCAQVSLGGGLAFATDLNKAGVQLQGTYSINDEWGVKGGLNFYLPDKYSYWGYETKISWWSLYCDAMYSFYAADKIHLYGVGGPLITVLRFKTKYSSEWEDEFGMGLDDSDSDVRLGLGIGCLGEYNLSEKLSLFSELKVNLASGSYINLNAGVLFRIN